jgi:hypothetical protein
MAIYDYLPKFNYIEPNNLKGLLPGFVVAQEERVAEDLLKDGMFENGKICALTADGIVAATGEEKALFIHFTEPLNTIRNSDQYFAVNVKNECPRLVQLIPGDEWMSTDPNCAIEGRIIKVEDGEGWYGVKTMANGDAGYHYVFLG